MNAALIKPPPLPKGAVANPLSCQGPGNHSADGYRCANSGLGGCLGYVCKRCAARDRHAKSFCETCNVCQLAENNGSSMTKALAVIVELNPRSLRPGKVGCASTVKGAKSCRKCIRKTCKHCAQTFHTHANRSSYCGELCKHAARRETHRKYDAGRREKALAVAA
jgi:hypothetical protein